MLRVFHFEQAVQLSWCDVAGKLDVIGTEFFGKLIDRNPDLLQLFDFRDDVDYRKSRSMKKARSVPRPLLIPIVFGVGSFHVQ